MDDLLIGVQNGENLDAIIQEVDTGLKQANFVIKQWVKTGDSLQKQEKFEEGKIEVLKKSRVISSIGRLPQTIYRSMFQWFKGLHAVFKL